MRKLIDDDGNDRGKAIGADLDLLLKSSRNVPKNSSLLKRDLVTLEVHPCLDSYFKPMMLRTVVVV